MTVAQELAVDVGAEVIKCLDSHDRTKLSDNKLVSPMVKAIRCLFAEAKVGCEVYSYNDLAVEDLLYIGNDMDEVEDFMQRVGLLPISDRGMRRVEDWYWRYVLKTGQKANTLLKMRVVLIRNESWEQRANNQVRA